MNNKTPVWVSWFFGIFGIVVGIVNAALTAVFSYTYLPAAFGDPAGMLPQYLAGFYGLLIMDIAYICWFVVYLRMAESKGQRDLSIILAGASLIASIIATITQLATNSFNLVDLSAYTQTVGFIALVTMIVITAAHIVSFFAYIYLAPQEKVRSKAAEIKADMLEMALDEMSARVGVDATKVVDQFAAMMRRDVLRQLGFTESLRQIGSGGDAIEGEHEVMPAAASESPPLPTETRPHTTYHEPDGTRRTVDRYGNEVPEQPPTRSDNGYTPYTIKYRNPQGRHQSVTFDGDDRTGAKDYARRLAAEGNTEIELWQDDLHLWSPQVNNGAVRP